MANLSHEEAYEAFKKFFCKHCKKERAEIVHIFKTSEVSLDPINNYNGVGAILYACVHKFYDQNDCFRDIWTRNCIDMATIIKSTIDAKTTIHHSAR